MVQRTLAQVRPELTQVSGATGMSLTDARFINRVNRAQEELMNEGDFPGVVDRWHLLFDEITGELVLPYYLDRLMQVTVDRCPVQIMSPWAEFVNYGTGPMDDGDVNGNGTSNLQPRNWISVCLDRGEVVSRFPVPVLEGPWVLRCYATVDEDIAGVPPQINLQGFKDRKVIRSLSDGTAGDWIDGVNLDIDFGVPYTETTQEFDSLTGVVKPETNGYVTIKAWNGTTLVTLSDYEPSETTPSYRNYFIPQLWRAEQGVRDRVVLARARRRYVPVKQDEDILIIGNVNALACMLIAQWKRDAGDYEAYQYQKTQAVDIMRKEATAYLGKSRTPGISFTRGFPVGAFPYVH